MTIAFKSFATKKFRKIRAIVGGIFPGKFHFANQLRLIDAAKSREFKKMKL